jgi:FkbM family methyltransferase
MKNIRAVIKKSLNSFPRLKSGLQWIYHNGIFYSSWIILRVKYPRLKIVRYSAKETKEQRSLGFQSQFGQDYFIFSEFFQNSKKKFFLDIGCNQPKFLNNSYYLEKYLDWDGLAFDPISTYEMQWKEHRSAKFILTALGSSSRDEEFIEIDNCQDWGNMMSGLKDHVREEDLKMGYKSYIVKVSPLSQILNTLNIEKIDFASMDVEGAELDILEGLDFSRHSPDVLLIENYAGLSGSDSLRKYLIERGYRYHARIWTCDDVFVKI